MVLITTAPGSGGTGPPDPAAEIQALFELCPDMLSVVGVDGRFRLVNPAYETVLGYTADDLRSLTYWELVHPDDLAKAPAPGERPGNEIVTEARIRCKDGSYKWTSWKAVLSPDGTALYAVGTDIAAAREAEQALRASEELFRRVFEDGPAGIWLVGAERQTLDVNGALCRMLGYTPDELRALTFADVTHPDDLEADLARARRLFAGEISSYTVQKRYLTKGGTPLWVDLTTTAVRDSAGEFDYAIGIVNDISERRAAEIALAQQQRQLADAEALAHAGSFTANPMAEDIRWSDELYRVFGLEPGAMTPTLGAVLELAHPDDRGTLQACIDRQMQTGAPFGLDYRINRFDGVEAWVRVRCSVVFGSDGPERVYGSVQDITDSKRLEESLASYAAIVQSSGSAIVSFTPDCIIRTWNQAAENIYGFTAAEAVGQPVSLLFPPSAGGGPRRSILERVALGDRIENHETRILRKDGNFVSISLNASPIRDEEGAVVGISSIAHDITELLKGRDALRHVHDDLARSVAELESRNVEVTQLNEMGDLLQSCSDLDEVSTVIRKYSRRLFPGQSGAVSVIAPSRNLLETVASWGAVPADVLFGPEDCWALRRGRVHRVEDDDDEVICPHVGSARKGSYVCVPMMAQGEMLGLLHLRAGASEDDKAAGEKRQRLAGPVAEHLSLALANFTLREKLRNQSIRDPLTGLFNRRYMEESLRRELARADRNSTGVAVLAIDVDHFKAFNDAHGHPAGDALLSGLGALLKERIRTDDIACRYGGEEFNLILPDCSLDEAVRRADEIRLAVKRLRVGVRAQTFGGITISIGVALFPGGGPDPESLLQRADEALYRAKGEGRDRVVAAAQVTQGGGESVADSPEP